VAGASRSSPTGEHLSVSNSRAKRPAPWESRASGWTVSSGPRPGWEARYPGTFRPAADSPSWHTSAGPTFVCSAVDWSANRTDSAGAPRGLLDPAVMNFLAIHRNRWRRRNADPNAVACHRDDGQPDVAIDHDFLAESS